MKPIITSHTIMVVIKMVNIPSSQAEAEIEASLCLGLFLEIFTVISINSA
jgi:hypothetical protein